MAALMTSVMDNSTKITGYIDTCRKMDISVLPPDINEGHAFFDAKDNHIIYGLAAIKNVGKNMIERIVEEREKGGAFRSLTDFYNRMESKDTNKRSIESLILAGAFDKLGGKRSQYMAVYKQIANGINLSRKNNISGQMDFFGLGGSEAVEDKDHLPDIPEFDSKDLLNYEKEVMGIYLSGHPLDKVRDTLERYISLKSNQLIIKEDEEENVVDGQAAIVGGILVEKKVIFTKMNKKMAFLTLEDTVGTMEVIVFPNLYDKFARINEERVFIIKGRVSIKEETNAVILADDLTTLENILNPGCDEPHILLRLEEEQRTPEIRNGLLNIFLNYAGSTKIIVENAENGERKPFPPKYNVTICDTLIREIADLIGENNIIVNK